MIFCEGEEVRVQRKKRYSFVKICKLVIFFYIVKVAAEEGEKIAAA